MKYAPLFASEIVNIGNIDLGIYGNNDKLNNALDMSISVR